MRKEEGLISIIGLVCDFIFDFVVDFVVDIDSKFLVLSTLLLNSIIVFLLFGLILDTAFINIIIPKTIPIITPKKIRINIIFIIIY